MNNTAAKIKLYWIEEQEIFQKLYQAIFTADSPFAVVGSSEYRGSGQLKVPILQASPDVLLWGCQSISAEMLDELSLIQERLPRLRVVFLVAYLKSGDLLLSRHFVENARTHYGFLFKKSVTRTEQLFSILSLVYMGQNIIDPMLTDLLSTDKAKIPIARGLTSREFEILNLIAKGYTNVAISENLCIDVKTVRHHINNIYSKLKISDEFDNRHPRVSATNVFHRLTGQLSFDDEIS